jgi:hypothetical protein
MKIPYNWDSKIAQIPKLDQRGTEDAVEEKKEEYQ